MSGILHQSLRGLCCDTGWNYAVFWKIKRRNRIFLTWEDGYYEFGKSSVHQGLPLRQSGLDFSSCTTFNPGEELNQNVLSHSVSKLAFHVYSFGEGLVGRVAFTGKHQWVFANKESGNPSSARFNPGEKYPSGWQGQFSAGIKTIAVIAVPQGVVQLGSVRMLSEDLSLVAHTRALFNSMQAVPGVFLSDLVESQPTSALPNFFNGPLQMAQGPCVEKDNVLQSHQSHHILSPHLPEVEPSSTMLYNPINQMLGPDSRSIARQQAQILALSTEATPLWNQASSRRATTRARVCQDVDEIKLNYFGSNSNPMPWEAAQSSLTMPLSSCNVSFPPLQSGSLPMTVQQPAQEVSLTESLWTNPESILSLCAEVAPCTAVSSLESGWPNSAGLSTMALPSSLLDSRFPQDHGLSKLDFPSNTPGRQDSIHGTAFGTSPNMFSSGDELSLALGAALTGHLNPGQAAHTGNCASSVLMQSAPPLSIYSSLLDDQGAMLPLTFQGITSTDWSLDTTRESAPLSSIQTNLGNAYGHLPLVAAAEGASLVSNSPAINVGCDTQNQFDQGLQQCKRGKKRARPKSGKTPRQRPRDRQQIQDRVKELRIIIPNTAKCSIDGLLEKTIAHMKHLRETVNEFSQFLEEEKALGVDKWSGMDSTLADRAATSPVTVEALDMPRMLLVEILCDAHSLMLEVPEHLRTLGLKVRKGAMEIRNSVLWARFIVQAMHDVHRMDVMWHLVQFVKSRAPGKVMSNTDKTKSMLAPVDSPDAVTSSIL